MQLPSQYYTVCAWRRREYETSEEGHSMKEADHGLEQWSSCSVIKTPNVSSQTQTHAHSKTDAVRVITYHPGWAVGLCCCISLPLPFHLNSLLSSRWCSHLFIIPHPSTSPPDHPLPEHSLPPGFPPPQHPSACPCVCLLASLPPL